MKPGRRPTPQQDFGPKSELAWLPVNRLSIDMRYQRALESRRSQMLVQRIAEEFQWARFGAVLVCPTALDAYAVLDGQHRLAGARMNGIIEVPCIVIEAPSLADQAALFLSANRDRVAVHSFALHHAAVAAGDPEHVSIARVCRDADVAIARYPIPASKLNPNQSLAIGAIKKAIKLRGEDTAVATLLTLRTAYSNLPGALRAHLIEGISALLALNQEITVDRLVAALKQEGLRGIERRVQDVMIEQGEGKANAVIIALRVMTGAEARKPISKTNLAGLPLVPAKVAPHSVVTLPRKPAQSGPITMPDLKPKPKPTGARDVTSALMGDPDPKRARS
jgi:hypothetical protein